MDGIAELRYDFRASAIALARIKNPENAVLILDTARIQQLKNQRSINHWQNRKR